jgi:hypothetical protein
MLKSRILMAVAVVMITVGVAMGQSGTTGSLAWTNDFPGMEIDKEQMFYANSTQLAYLEKSKKRLWAGAVLFGLASGIFYSVAESSGKSGWYIPASITGTVGSVMVPCAVVRTAVYHRAKWEVRYYINKKTDRDPNY